MKRLLYASLLLVFSCGPEEAVRLRLTPAQTDAYQEIAGIYIDSMRPALDSICEVTFEERVAAATDSIVQRRLEEELRLRTRLGQTMPQ